MSDKPKRLIVQSRQRGFIGDKKFALALQQAFDDGYRVLDTDRRADAAVFGGSKMVVFVLPEEVVEKAPVEDVLEEAPVEVVEDVVVEEAPTEVIEEEPKQEVEEKPSEDKVEKKEKSKPAARKKRASKKNS